MWKLGEGTSGPGVTSEDGLVTRTHTREQPMRHPRHGAAAAMVALSVITSSCMRSYSPVQPEVRVTPMVALAAAPLVAPRCPRDSAGLAHGKGRAIVAGSHPPGFVPVRVIRCAVINERQRADGNEVTTIRQESGHSSATLLDALELDDLAAPTPTSKNQPGFACAAFYTFPFLLLLVDETGRAYRPRIPITACGNPQQPVLDALTAIVWTSAGSFSVVWH